MLTVITLKLFFFTLQILHYVILTKYERTEQKKQQHTIKFSLQL